MENQNYKEWMASLKAGDKVAIKRNSGWSIQTVKRLTATLVVVKDTYRFKRKDGYLLGGSAWDFTRIEPLSQEVHDAAERDKLAAWLGYLKKPSLAVLRAMKAAHDEAVKAEAGK